MKEQRKRLRPGGTLILLLVLLLLNSLKPGDARSKPADSPCRDPLYIEVGGDIESPGVFACCRAATITELVGRAGGRKPCIPLPEVFKDIVLSSGEKILIRCGVEGHRLTRSEMSAFHKVTLGIPISVNAESEEGFTAIPGIGPGLGKAIVQERMRRGTFNSLDELVLTKGISCKLFKKIRYYLSL